MFSEVNVLRKCDHPNILKLYELFEDKKNYYLITEYTVMIYNSRFMEGGEVLQRLKTSEFKIFSEKQTADIMKQLLSAVLYCHK
jgi:calcium-dependent protein kinase